MEIVKVQIPVSSNEVEPMILVYNRSRKRQCFIPATKKHCEDFNGALKSFWWAEWNEKKKGYDTFIKPAPWQDW